MSEHLAVMSIGQQVADPLKAGMALGTAMRLENAMMRAEAAGMKTADINVTDLKFLIEYVTPFIQRVGQVIYEDAGAQRAEQDAAAHAKAEIEKIQKAWKATRLAMKEHDELAGSPYGSRVR